MKCINKTLCATGMCAAMLCFVSGCSGKEKAELDRPFSLTETVTAQQIQSVDQSQDQATNFLATNLCVAADANSPEDASFDTSTAEVVGIMDTGTQQILYQKNIFKKMYPASTTKIMTAYLAIKYGKMDDVVTIQDDVLQIPGDASSCYLKPGDTLTLEQLLYGLMLKSGNDAALAIADHISGSVDAFVELMNEEAKALGATATHFTNPNGLHDEEHYTTAYDLYLMFQEAVKQEAFCKLLETANYQTQYTSAEQKMVSVEWETTNRFLTGEEELPQGVKIIGGKTGTTDIAGHCDILYSQNADGGYRISVVMRANTKDDMYDLLAQMVTKTE